MRRVAVVAAGIGEQNEPMMPTNLRRHPEAVTTA